MVSTATARRSRTVFEACRRQLQRHVGQERIKLGTTSASGTVALRMEQRIAPPGHERDLHEHEDDADSDDNASPDGTAAGGVTAQDSRTEYQPDERSRRSSRQTDQSQRQPTSDAADELEPNLEAKTEAAVSGRLRPNVARREASTKRERLPTRLTRSRHDRGRADDRQERSNRNQERARCTQRGCCPSTRARCPTPNSAAMVQRFGGRVYSGARCRFRRPLSTIYRYWPATTLPYRRAAQWFVEEERRVCPNARICRKPSGAFRRRE
jgi:hypothetical protein